MAANRADYDRNKEKRKKSAYHRQARLFIRQYAEQDDVDELKELIVERENKLKEDKNNV